MRDYLFGLVVLLLMGVPSFGAALPRGGRVGVSVRLSDKEIAQTPGWHQLHADVVLGDRSIDFVCMAFFPPCYGTKPLPVVMTLHNRANFGGHGGESLMNEGLGKYLLSDNVDLRATGERPAKPLKLATEAQFIGLIPQCPPDCTWEMPGMARVLDQFLGQVLAVYRADSSRVYLTGFSYGASSTWIVAEQIPQRFAAIAPIDGRATADPKATIRRLKNVGIYASAGGSDQPFLGETRRMHDALGAAWHTDFVYREVVGGNHFCYGSVYNDPDFWRWMFAHHTAPSQPIRTLKTASTAQ